MRSALHLSTHVQCRSNADASFLLLMISPHVATAGNRKPFTSFSRFSESVHSFAIGHDQAIRSRRVGTIGKLHASKLHAIGALRVSFTTCCRTLLVDIDFFAKELVW